MKSVSEINFNQEVIQSHLPVVVSFWAPWCGLCRLIEPILQQIQANGTIPLKVVRINADENFHLARQYRLQSLPTLLFFEGGELRERFDPQSVQGDLRAAVQQLVESVRCQPCLQKD
ncbi:co-chaperone YbbN [Synechococcus sp. PCC 6312]|uniref:thioredoxin family protein n=1 Tax=Synechococcus sp. (strain ATCC 27167 / PCC 6312) TaxID=195253 RepID=UPI00029F356F|nr:thioredoxin family protein [Synechococcus sp. PCC 6312]AFY62431.1 thioredoxin domain-containing protein [Synechococcus sp. PCC 6312]